MSDSCLVPFKLHYAETKKNLSQLGDAVPSEVVSAGGHLWRISCYPCGIDDDDDSDDGDDDAAEDYLGIYLELMSKASARGVKAVFKAFLMNKKGEPSSSHADRIMETRDLESRYVVDGWVTIVWGVMVVRDDDDGPPLIMPCSDIGTHLGRLLDCAEDGNSDVSLVVGGDTFPAHRAVLAARSPVLGSMAEATMSTIITLQDIEPATFKVFLRFIYTDTLPDTTPIEMLKLMCAKKLWDGVSVDTVADTLSCAETYSCAELKTKCIAFFAEEENFREAVLTDGFVALVHKFPGIIAELRKNATSSKKRKNPAKN
ncbi:hypothetical protein BRADI_3g40785v3 [Brachypodium distachyon]|uniref:BTB domain-containing protein n=1 Tax=Brachypodium distachyon TaxID=15368 RepID=A0A2K2D2F1_BRADI|nr:hypothetical protein BRADI_3g40785v3 [Brachypodium distachyon]